ncbi:MAG: hypothetical protein KJ634_00040 [Gammaproteobacteria bacterium]|nr:hypothetical protein [Gammaproteobacteria bacterium]MBU1413987.1 hypothetical protein [Gammaproteobacteria bacterium]
MATPEPQSSASSEFAPLYSKAERIRLVLIWGAIWLLAVAFLKLWFFPAFKQYVEVAPCTTVFGFDGVAVLFFGVFVGIPVISAMLVGGIFGVTGYKVLRDGQFPPIGEKVLRPTRIRKGWQSRLLGYLHFLPVVLFLTLAVWGGFQAEHFSNLPRTAQSCPASHEG